MVRFSLYAFDLLYFDGHDLTGTELSVRRHLLDGAGGAILLSEEVGGDGAKHSGECAHHRR